MDKSLTSKHIRPLSWFGYNLAWNTSVLLVECSFAMKTLTYLSYSSIAKGALLTSILNTARCDRIEGVDKPQKPGQTIGQIYSHVVIGFGTAGTAAVDQLLQCGHPLNSILVVDPQIRLKSYNFNPKTEKRLTFHASSAQNIDVAHKIIQLEDGSRVRYQNCLISVGSAPIPLQPLYVDADCDLKRTLVDLTHLNAPYELYRTISSSSDALVVPNINRSAKSIALVGASSFETVELAGKLAIAAAQEHFASIQALQQLNKQREKAALSNAPDLSIPMGSVPKNANTEHKEAPIHAKVDVSTVPKDEVFLVYPAYGPMSHNLPRYLSLAVAKRLQVLGVNLVPYSYVRYLGAADSSTSGTKRTNSVTSNTYTTSNSTSATTSTNNSPQMVLFLAKTYDSLNTTSLVADKVTFAPTSVPTNADRKQYHLDPFMYTSTNNTHCAAKANASHPHGFILRSGLELDSISGGVVVNQSLQACDGVYVAGDVASVCNSSRKVDLRDTVDSKAASTSTMRSNMLQQRGVVRGYQNALYSGTVAARNMAYNSAKHTANEKSPLLYNHIPVYEAHSADLGVHFAFIGNCSTALESHGYWWKLYNATSTATAAKSPIETVLRPPLGLGVVFYVDSDSVINGVLVSGLPNTTSSDGTKSKYTERVNELCKQMVGKSVKSLHQYTINGNNAYKRIALDESFLTATESDTLPPDESDLHAQNKQDTTTITSTTCDAQAGSLTTKDSINIVVNTGTEVYTSQALSWEARRLLSPVLSPGLYKNTTVITEENLSTDIVNLPSTSALTKAAQAYPRPLYRYCGPSHTTIKDLAEPHKDAIVRPMITREQLFQPEFANTGSKADNLQSAYKRSMAKDLF